MSGSTERSVLGVIDTSTEIRDLLTLVFEDEGFRVISAFVPDLKRGTPTIEDFLRQHRPVAVIYDIAIPYEENWRFFKTIEESAAGRLTRFVLTCINKRALESLVGATPALELIGKPYDLDLLVAAVRRVIDVERPA